MITWVWENVEHLDQTWDWEPNCLRCSLVLWSSAKQSHHNDVHHHKCHIIIIVIIILIIHFYHKDHNPPTPSSVSLRKKSASSLHKSVVKIMFYKKSFTNFESVLRNVIVKIFSSASAHVWARVHLVRFQLVNRVTWSRQGSSTADWYWSIIWADWPTYLSLSY